MPTGPTSIGRAGPRLSAAIHSSIGSIGSETEADAGTIGDVTIAAFEALEISHHTEQFIVEALRAADALTVSLVAELDGRVVGHIAFSPVTLSDGTQNWYGLGPVSVLSTYQRQGIGKALIREGLSRLKAMGAQGCCLVGHPDYYARFGFRNVPDLVVEGVPHEVFFSLSFDGYVPRGTVAFHEGFKAAGERADAGGPPLRAWPMRFEGPLRLGSVRSGRSAIALRRISVSDSAWEPWAGRSRKTPSSCEKSTTRQALRRRVPS